MTDGQGPPTLPRLLRWMLARILPPGRRDDVLGDVEEAWQARRGRKGGRFAHAWLWKEAGALVLWRLGAALRSGVHEGATARAPGLGHLGEPRRGRRMATMGWDFLQDLRFAVRTLARRPGFALTAICVLGLGIGAPTTVFTLVERIFFERPPEVTEPHRLVRLWRSWAPGEGGGALQHPDYLYYRANATALEDLAAWGGQATAAYSVDGATSDQLSATFVSHNWFHVLGTQPQVGRFFLPEENDEPGEDPVMVVSDGFWRRALGADPDVVGRTLSLDGTPYTVIGVAPQGFRGLSAFATSVDVWVPIAMFGDLQGARNTGWWERLAQTRFTWLNVVGRLAPGVTFEAAEASLQGLSAALEYPEREEGDGLLVSREAIYTPSEASTLGTLFRMLVGVVLAVTAIATANVAVLLLSRATTRVREMGIRTALGAGRGRVVRQLLAESLVLGLAGGAVGVALAFAFSDSAAALLPYPFPEGFVPDPRVLAAAVGLAVATSVLAGLAPALSAAKADVLASVEGTRVAGGRSRLRSALVVGQVSLSLVLVAGALLFARSFWSARTQDLGFATQNRLILRVNLRNVGYGAEEGRIFIERALERLEALPRVRAATTAMMTPFGGEWSTDLQPPPGAVPNTEEGVIFVGLNTVGPHYFELMEMPLVRGRGIGPEDHADAPPSVVVNETLAALLWPGQEAVGQTLPLRDDTDFTVVGVARDATYYQLGEEPSTQLWSSVQQVYQPDVHFILHTDGPPTALAAVAQDALRALEPRLAFRWISTLDAVFEEVTARYQVTATLVGLFGALALVLASAGLYAVVSFVVAQRRREIGVRMALGAPRARVAREVLGSGLALTGIGVVLGLTGALFLRRFTATFLYGVAPEDPLVLVGAAGVLVSVTLLASLGPARRATRVDPSEALRAE